MVELREVDSKAEFELAAELFREYAGQLRVDLSFQNFDKELDNISLQYRRPLGVLVIAYADQINPIGCFGIRKFEDGTCELKRMYLRNEARGKGIGKLLLSKSIETARELGYSSMRLDTLSTMKAAIALYKKAGFYEIEAYRYNPMEGTRYFELLLD